MPAYIKLIESEQNIPGILISSLFLYSISENLIHSKFKLSFVQMFPFSLYRTEQNLYIIHHSERGALHRDYHSPHQFHCRLSV